MYVHDLFNPIAGFDYKILDDREFGEDAVREEIISPILKALGYSASGVNRIIRSRKLVHPFVSIGSARKEIYIVPDYLMEVDGKNAWILEAKAPNESVIKSAHVEQAYSYAIHSEIRVKYFALCNGKEFALYAIGEPEMLLLHFPIQALAHYWEMIKRRLAPDKVYISSKKINKDLGLHLKRLGFTQFESIIFIKVLVPFIARMDVNLFSFSSGTTSEGEVYCASFDFDQQTALQLKELIPQQGFDILMKPFDGNIQKIVFADARVSFNIRAVIGEKLEENADEIFLPLRVENFMS